MFCMRCGQEVPDSAAFCSNCGQAAQQPVAATATYAPPPPPTPQSSVVAYGTPRQQSRSVSGALLFFCVAFTILFPVWTLGQYAVYHFAIFRHLTPLTSLSLLRLVFGIVVGIMLWTLSPAALMLARIYFAVSGVLTVWGLYSWANFFVRYHNNSSFVYVQPLVFGFLPHVAFLIIGILYFATSERVRATYGSKLFG